MIKKQFIKRIQLIQNFHSQQDTLGQLIDKIADGWSTPTIGIGLVEEIISMINEMMRIKDKDLLEWWLYDEGVDKVIFINDVEISVRTLDELYDYIVKYGNGD